MNSMMPWECDDCKHKLTDSPFVTYIECPKCSSENFHHGQTIDEDMEECNIYDDED